MYEAKDFSSLLGTPGFSDDLLNNHFKLYQGYVKNTNGALELMKSADSYSYGEIKRRFGWEFNGMRLHEYYFGNMVNGGNVLEEGSKLAEKINADFGSFESFKEDYIKIGSMRGIGWVILTHDKDADKLFNVWINEHDLGFLAGTTPLLVMDVFEHAFVTDYGLNKADYINSFFNAINWQEVSQRFEA